MEESSQFQAKPLCKKCKHTVMSVLMGVFEESVTLQCSVQTQYPVVVPPAGYDRIHYEQSIKNTYILTYGGSLRASSLNINVSA